MEKIGRFIRFMLSGNILIFLVVLIVYTMISFIYYYFDLKQAPTAYFSWWWENITSFDIMNYKYYIIAFEIVLFVLGIINISKKDKKA